MAARRGIAILVAALAVATLLNANGLLKTAETQQQGARRTTAVAVMRQIDRVSRFLGLTAPRHGLQVAIGRADEDRIDTTVHLAAPSPARRPVPRAHRLHHAAPLPAQRPHVKPPPKPKPLFTPRHPLRLWVAGDSLAEVPGQALERAAGTGGSVDVVGVESRLSTGLTRPDLYNWFDRFEQELGRHPNVVVLSFGADDEHDYMSGVPDGVTVGKLGSPSWVREYRRRVAGVTREFNQHGIYVVWIGTPIPRGSGYVYGFRVVNRIFRSVAAAHKSLTTYIDTWHMFATRTGRYADYLRNAGGQLVRVRATDGIHYEPAAGDEIARAVLAKLGGVYGLASGSRKVRSS
jgi:hypothetical protein